MYEVYSYMSPFFYSFLSCIRRTTVPRLPRRLLLLLFLTFVCASLHTVACYTLNPCVTFPLLLFCLPPLGLRFFCLFCRQCCARGKAMRRHCSPPRWQAGHCREAWSVGSPVQTARCCGKWAWTRTTPHRCFVGAGLFEIERPNRGGGGGGTVSVLCVLRKYSRALGVGVGRHKIVPTEAVHGQK